MNLLLTGKSIFVICFVIYIGVWVLLVLRYFLYTRRKVEQIDVYKVRRLHMRAMLHRYLGWIWVLLLGIFLESMLPNVEVVRHDPQRRPANSWRDWEVAIADSVLDRIGNEKEYFVERYYVLFNYRGQPCTAFNSYVFNETDSLMAIYQTRFWSANLEGVDRPSRFTLVKPGEMIMIPHRKSSFYFEFEAPSKLYGNKEGSEKLAINLYGKALRDAKHVQAKLEERNKNVMRMVRSINGSERMFVEDYPYEVVIVGEEYHKRADSVATDDPGRPKRMEKFGTYDE